MVINGHSRGSRGPKKEIHASSPLFHFFTQETTIFRKIVILRKIRSLGGAKRLRRVPQAPAQRRRRWAGVAGAFPSAEGTF